MKGICITLLLMISSLGALSVHDWNQIRFSQRSSEGKLYLRSDRPQSTYNTNQVVYNPGSGATQMDLSLQNAATNTFQAYLNAGTGRSYYGLRRQAGNSPMQIVPMHYTGTALPAPNLLTKVSDDPANDNATQHYDIIADYVALSDTKLIVGLQNRGGGFPTSAGFLSWNTYMCAVGDPTLEDPNDPDAIVYALQYVSAAGVMTPGLYKVTGTSISDVTKIADIQYQINTASNTLVMSCDFSALLADADFMSWFNPANPSFGLISVTAKVTLSGVTQQDNSAGGVIHPGPLYVDSSASPVADLSSPILQIGADDIYFQAQYTKPENRFDWGFSFRTEDGTVYPMSTADPEYAPIRHYRSANLISIFPEVDNKQGRAWLELVPGEYLQGNWYSYSFVRALNSPQNMQMQVDGNNVQITWDPVTQTPSGTTITADSYTVEYASSPDAEYEFLLTTAMPAAAIPMSTLGDKAFIKVSAKKIIP